MREAHPKPATSPAGYNHLIIVFAASEEPSAVSQWRYETIGRFGKSPFASVSKSEHSPDRFEFTANSWMNGCLIA